METSQDTRALIIENYKKHLLTEGTEPVSVYRFCNQLGIGEPEFYTHFGSFEAVESAIWQSFAKDTIARLGEDESAAAFSAREKVLAFYFALAEELKKNRSFILLQLKSWKPGASAPAFLRDFRASFTEWFSLTLQEGKQTGEVANRPFIDSQYVHLFWAHWLFILQFWRSDTSADFEKTDIAIEKSVNLAFDLIGKGVVEGALDFGKFLYQQSYRPA
jgi:AcrR family transcriptional regulator